MLSHDTSGGPECPDENTLVGLLEGAGDPATRARFERHVEDCERCYEMWRELALATDSQAREREVVDAAYAITEVGSVPAARTERGSIPARLGRYLVIEQLGAGGMGVVFSTYDPELDRKVAIKLVHPRRDSDDERARLLQEARALAQLSHRSVVSVFDVGTLDDDVFIAMEFVDGVTLSAWRDATTRTWREVLDVYLDAGAGLAAAHAAGLVHRDFKPQNVMVSDDGVVKVLDFGLARVDVEARAVTAPRTTRGSEELTRTGTIVGTPAYMSPEQFQHSSVDARSDQFSFCVALFEALYGEHPFPYSGFEDLRAAVMKGQVSGPKRHVAIPGSARRALYRGLSREPSARFPTMDALLDELRHEPAGSRRRLVAAATLLVVGGGAVIAGRWSSRAPVCSSGQALAHAVWGSDAARSKLAARFTASTLPYAEGMWGEVERRLDAYAESWAVMRDDSCEATRVRGEQSGELLDLRTACLDKRLGELEALINTFQNTPALDSMVEQSVQAVESLRSLEACANASALRAVIPLPENEGARSEIKKTRRELAEINATLLSGQSSTARPRAEVAVERAAQLAYLPLLAEARLAHGKALERDGVPDDAIAQLRRALAEALEAGDDLSVTESASELVNAYAERKGDPARALEWVPLAEAALRRAGGDEDLESRLRLYQGWAQARGGEYEAARETLGAITATSEPDARGDSLLALRAEFSAANTFLMSGEPTPAIEVYEALRPRFERALDPGHPYLAVVLDNTATAYLQLGRYNDARAVYRQAFELRERALGPEHPDLVDSLVNMSTVASADSGDESEEALLLRAARLLGDRPDDPRQASIHNNLGLIYDDHDPERALEHFQRACDNITRRLGEDHPDQYHPRIGIGHAHFKAGRYELALVAYRRAEALAREALGDTHRRVGIALKNQAEVHQEQGGLMEAEGLFERALAIFESIEAPDATRLEALLPLAELKLARGGEAKMTVEKIQTIIESPSFVAEAEHDAWSARARATGMFLIARAVVDAKRKEGRSHAQTALTLLSSQAPSDRVKAMRSEIERWLREHP